MSKTKVIVSPDIYYVCIYVLDNLLIKRNESAFSRLDTETGRNSNWIDRNMFWAGPLHWDIQKYIVHFIEK